MVTMRYEPPDLGAAIDAAYGLMSQSYGDRDIVEELSMRFDLKPMRVDENGTVTIKASFERLVPPCGDDPFALPSVERIERNVEYVPLDNGTAILDGRSMMKEDVVTVLLSRLVSMVARLEAEMLGEKE